VTKYGTRTKEVLGSGFMEVRVGVSDIMNTIFLFIFIEAVLNI
jgi:hypothetical protein